MKHSTPNEKADRNPPDTSLLSYCYSDYILINSQGFSPFFISVMRTFWKSWGANGNSEVGTVSFIVIYLAILNMVALFF